jgi:hypothetical protein
MSNTFFGFFPGRSNLLLAVVPEAMNRNSRQTSRFESASFAQRKCFKQRPASLEPLEARGGLPPGLAMACSLKDSQQGSRGFNRPHPTLRTSFPLPIPGRPNGHREAPSLQCNFQRIAQAIFVCNRRCSCLCAVLQLFENSNEPAFTQAQYCGKRAPSVERF